MKKKLRRDRYVFICILTHSTSFIYILPVRVNNEDEIDFSFVLILPKRGIIDSIDR